VGAEGAKRLASGDGRAWMRLHPSSGSCIASPDIRPSKLAPLIAESRHRAVPYFVCCMARWRTTIGCSISTSERCVGMRISCTSHEDTRYGSCFVVRGPGRHDLGCHERDSLTCLGEKRLREIEEGLFLPCGVTWHAASSCKKSPRPPPACPAPPRPARPRRAPGHHDLILC
jgi:hypothetical protein